MSISENYILEKIEALEVARFIKKAAKQLQRYAERTIESGDKIKYWKKEYRNAKTPAGRQHARKRIKFWTNAKKNHDEKILKVKKRVRKAT